MRWLTLLALLLAVGVYRAVAYGRVDTTALPQEASGPRLRGGIIGGPSGPREACSGT